MNYKITHQFFHDFYEIRDFKTKLDIRIKDIIKRNFLKTNNTEFMINEYFVEIFSWSIFTKEILERLDKLIFINNIKGIIDPCCGNAFHTYLFNQFLNLKVYSIDIQDEPNSWMPITVMDGRTFIKKLDITEHLENALLLSWVDYESLNLDLLNLYQGNLVISVGNYKQHGAILYPQELENKFNLIDKFTLEMPWNLTESIEIYYRK